MISRLILYGAALSAAFFLIWISYFRTPEPDFETRKAEFFAAVGEGRMDAAERLLDQLGDDYPKAVHVPLLRGWLKDGLKDLPAALEAYKNALPLATSDEQVAEIELAMADLKRRIGSITEAQELLENVEKRRGETESSKCLKIAILIDQKRAKDALNELEEFAEKFPVNPHARRMRRTVERILAEASEASSGVDAATQSDVQGRVRAP
jgi:tetratricopeptide (TPR) repeat protein